MSPFEPNNPDFARAVKDSFERQGLMQTLGIELVLVEPGTVELGVALAERITQQHGYFHGALIGAGRSR
jgi:acyl-coenzyme A thioesterase PaaI-like protein